MVVGQPVLRTAPCTSGEPVRPRRLDPSDEPAIEELLQTAPVLNLFLLGFLSVHPVDRAWWYGIDAGTGDGRLGGVVMILPGRLAVPFCPDPVLASALGKTLRQLHRPCMLVGPREACDQMWAIWGRSAPTLRHYDQRLYVLETPPPGAEPEGFRRARESDVPTVAAWSSAMTLEDLGFDPAEESPTAHRTTVQDRVRAGRTWVLQREGSIVFQINVGTVSRRGCQVGGTYVPPAERGRGYASSGVAATCRRLLASHPRVTLHVNEANLPAVRVYEKVGFVRSEPMRLITVRGDP